MGLVVRCEVPILILAALFLLVTGHAWATGLGTINPIPVSTPEEVYCLNRGGSPYSGNCYFPDGGYCDLGDFYNGTCPSQATKEQALWEAEAYAFLHSDNAYYPPGSPYLGPSIAPYYGAPMSYASVGSYSTANYWLSEADKLYLTGSYEQAAAMYNRALDLNPSLLAGWLNLGNALYFLGKHNESLDAYNSAIRLNHQSALAWQGIGLDLLALNRTSEANDALAKARALQG